ncbi:glycine cleavage system aminomethyltransferase GcvT [Paenibacillus sp. CAA11]|uniref:glycine cleavage system aminomethyltransferase GcvT n=1 Tax=Paenibacillus sp. CAA11 TaxID=1532905 RepID=UPI000D334EE7|nr:glycine cleavage system aminomethyltransferase GcvT [Paenibacillus sp. CAA11]AWB44959.1 glycine cleavage system aminomethyltransferase GcvT [Paenibacillus sp. CAA11]
MSDLQRTPLYPCYATFPGVRCIDFGGWELPVQFEGIQKEHEAVRKRAGLFDVSHMGEFLLQGPGALAFIQQMTTNDAASLQIGAAQYTLMCYPDGGVVDDLLVYRLAEQQFMLVVNASNLAKDWEWLQQHLSEEVYLTNISDQTALLALQGPLAADILVSAAGKEPSKLAPFRFIQHVQLFGAEALISRTGYTGEDGFELYLPAENAAAVWNGLLEIGSKHGLQPAGLGARDTLRFEAKLPLYGQELSSTISPLEAGVGFFVKLDKGDFIGRDALAAQKNAGPPRKLVGVEMIDRGIPRSHYPVYSSGVRIGEVTTGTQSPTLKRNLGLALIDSRYASLGTPVEVEIRGKRLQAQVIKTPFYKRQPSPPKGAEPS